MLNFQLPNKLSATGMMFSMNEPNRLVVSASENFGIVGKGGFFELQYDNQNISLVGQCQADKCLMDVSYIEQSPIVVAAAEDAHSNGSIHFFNKQQFQQVKQLNFQTGISSVSGSYKNQTFLATDKKGIVKVFNLENDAPLEAVNAHNKVAQAVWSPKSPSIFASVGDNTLKIFDLNKSQKLIAQVNTLSEEMTLDFCKYSDLIMTAGNNCQIKIWDLRQLGTPIKMFQNHRYPIKSVKCSPLDGNIIGSGSYDMNVVVNTLQEGANPVVHLGKHHTEFVQGVDFSMYNQGQIGSTSWDGKVCIFNYNQQQNK